MTDNKNIVLTDEQNVIIAARFPDDPANAVRAQSAVVEILSKLHAEGEPSDDELLKWAGEEQFFLFCDEDDFLQIARAVLQRYAAENSEKGADVSLPPRKSENGSSSYEIAHAMAYNQALDDVTKLNADRQQRGGDVTLRRGIEQWTASDPSSMSKQSPAAIYYALDDARSDILTLYREVQSLSAALAAQPAASAEPSKEECWDIWQIATRAEGFLDDRIHSFACDLLNRYGRPAGDVQPVAWVAADTLNSPHPKCVSSLAYMSQIDQDRGREYVPLYTAPVAASAEPSDEEAVAPAPKGAGDVGELARHDQWFTDYVQSIGGIIYNSASLHTRAAWLAALADRQQRGGDVDEGALADTPRYKTWLHLRTHGQWPDDIPEWAKDHNGHMNDMVAARAVIEELAVAAQAATKGESNE